MRGKNEAVAVESLGAFTVRDTAAAKTLEAMYAGTGDQVLNGTGRTTFEAVALLQSLQKTPYAPADGATYPAGRFGDSLRQIAQMIKANVGVEVAFADIGDWDHHAQEPTRLPARLAEFGASLAAFYRDMGDRMEDVVLVTMSEFGRTAKENGDRGTDHGHANAMFVMGGPVQGGQGLRQMARPGAGAVIRESRSRADHGFPRCPRRIGIQPSRQSADRQGLPGYAAGPNKFKGYLRA